MIETWTFDFEMDYSRVSHFFRAIGNSFAFIYSFDAGAVEDGSLEPGKLQLKVAVSNFGSVVVDVLEEDQGLRVKMLALQQFVRNTAEPLFEIPTVVNEDTIGGFRLLRTKTRRKVGDNESLKDLTVANKEEFFMIRVRAPITISVDELNLSSPSELQIREKTAMFKKLKPQPPPFSIINLLHEDDMRKIFVTLAQESAFVLAVTPYADKLIDFYRKRIHYCIKHHKNAENVLVQLGFSLNSVQRAMKLKANNARAALDWLIDNESSVGYNETHGRSTRTSYQRASSTRRGSILSVHFEGTSSDVERFEGLLEIVKFYADKDEIVEHDNIHEMVHMGFDIEVSRDALRLTRNNIAAAIAHISGDTNPSITELRDGLSETSEIRKKFMESSKIQLALSEPRSFELFINILDNPSQANAWSPISDVGALMTHIIITYHEQKHICATNQFNESRLPISALSAPN